MQNKRTPKVSVVLTTRDREDKLERSLASVLNQTFRDFELIVVDDASTDGTSEAVRSRGDDRITYIRHESHRGGPAARNTGIRAARGEFIAFLDDDDEWMSKKIEKELSALEGIPEEVGLVYCAAEVVNDTNGKVLLYHVSQGEGDVRERILAGPVAGCVSKVMVRRSCFEKAGYFDEALTSCQDWDMWMRVADHYRFKYVPDMLVRIYIHERQISKNFQKLIPGRTMMVKKHYDRFSKRPGVLVTHLKRLGKMHFINGTWAEGRRWFGEAMKVNPFETVKIAAWCVFELPFVAMIARRDKFLPYRGT